jgi:hypothetical protein
MRILAICLLLSLAACAAPPSQTRNACAIFEQRDGLFNNWRRAAEATEREYGVPVPVLMATIYVESSFRGRAKPPRTKLFGFIPWKRQSSAFGYSQALDGTWDRYKRETGRFAASRTSFSDAIQFIGWYHYQSHLQNGIELNDPYNLYLAYYVGHTGYSKGSWRGNSTAQRTAAKMSSITSTYAAQLQQCPG